MYFLIGLLIFVIAAFRVSKYNKWAYGAFFVESAPDKKQPEIDFFWKRVKLASSKEIRQQIIDRQSDYYKYHKNARIWTLVSVASLVAGVIIEWLAY